VAQRAADVGEKLCAIGGDVWKTSASTVVEATLGADVGRLVVGEVIRKPRFVEFEVVCNCELLVIGNREIICETTGGSEELEAYTEIGLQG
jgi:hypothetical protein